MGFWTILAFTLSFGTQPALSKGNSPSGAVRAAFDLKVFERNCQERLDTGLWLKNIGHDDQTQENLLMEDCLPTAKARFEAFVAQAETQEPNAVWTDIKKQRKNLSQHFSYAEIVELFPDGKKFSVSEWKVFQEWFGDSITQKFQKELFPISKDPTLLKAQIKEKNILWILDPYRKILSTENTLDPVSLKSIAPNLEIVELSPYGNSESQADELKSILQVRLKKKYTIISSGGASAIMMKTLDLHPALLSHPNIQSWLNLDGKLFGSKPDKGRSLASAPDTFQERVLAGVRIQYLDSLERTPPLGKGFPIINVLPSLKKNELLRAKIIPEEQSIEIQNWKAIERIFQEN